MTCVEALSDGTETCGCRRPGPSSEGRFVDFVAGPDAQVSIAVSAFRHSEGTDFSQIWSFDRLELRASRLDYQPTRLQEIEVSTSAS